MPMATTDERIRAYKQSFVPVQRLLDAGRFPDALAELERIMAANAECAEAHNDLAVLYHAAGRLSDADRESRRAVELDPFHADIRENRNAIATAVGNAAAAAPATRPMMAPPTTSALDGAPLYRDVLRTAETLMASGQLDAAVAEIERFVDRQPATAEAWNDLGVLHRDAGRLVAANAALVVALTIEPMNRQAGHNLTRVLIELGRHVEALRTLEPFLTRAPRDVDALTLAGDISLALQQPSDAGAFYRSALAVDPSNVELAVKLANAAAAPLAAPALAAPAWNLPAPAPAAAPSWMTSAAAPAPTPAPAAMPTWMTPAASPAAMPESLRALEYDPRVRLVTPDETYDTVTCKTPLDRLPNPIAALAEMARLLKPGGKLWIDLGGPLEVIKHAAPTVSPSSSTIDLLPALRAR